MDVAATLVIFPVPTIALILRRTCELLFGDVGAVSPKASTAFRKFVISYGRLFGHGILGYREQSRDEFSRPFGKEAPYANAHCSPHHFIAKRSYGSASGRARPFHTTIPGVTRPHCLTGCRVGPTDQPAQSATSWAVPTLRWANGDGAIWPWAYRVCKMPCAQGVRARLPPPRVSRSSRWPVRCLKNRIAPSPGGH